MTPLFPGNIGEIGSVPGIQKLFTDAGSLAGLELRGSDLRFATGDENAYRLGSGNMGWALRLHLREQISPL